MATTATTAITPATSTTTTSGQAPANSALSPTTTGAATGTTTGANATNAGTTTTAANQGLSASDINAIYQQAFGRPADAGGLAYWQNVANTTGDNSGALTSSIKANALGQDIVAENDKSLNPSTSWSLDSSALTNPNLLFNANTNSWQLPAAPAPAPAPAPAYTPATATPYSATNWNVTPNQTVSGQLQQVLDPNNPLMVQAAGLANEQTNSRGLVNSSLGVSAADQAMYSQAVPIATANAQTYANSGQLNAEAANAASQFNSGAQNQASLTNSSNVAGMINTQTSAAASEVNAQTAAQAGIQQQQISSNASMTNAQLQANTNIALQNIQSQYGYLASTNSNATSLIQQYQSNIAAIQSNTSMDGTAKADAINTQLSNLQYGLQSLAASAPAASAVGTNQFQSAVSQLNIARLWNGASASSGGSAGGNSGGTSAATQPAGLVSGYSAPDGSSWISQSAYQQAINNGSYSPTANSSSGGY